MNAIYVKQSRKLQEVLVLMWVAILFGSPIQAQIYSSQSGDWTMASTWVGGVTPINTDKVIIQAGHNVILNSAISLDDSLKVNGTLTLPGSITGMGHKLIMAGGNFILQGGGLYGSGEWIVRAGATMDIASGGIIGSTTILRNHGTINWNSGDVNPAGLINCYYSIPPSSFLYNEAGGTLIIQAGSDIILGYTQVHNYGVVNKLNANTLTLSNECIGSPFYNYPSATLNLSQGQMVLNKGGSLEGIVNIVGTMTINNESYLGGLVSLTGSMYNNGSMTTLAGLSISGNGYLNNTGIFNLPFDVSFPVDIDNTGTIGGAGIKTYSTGIVVNINGGTLSGNEHVIANGTTLNVNAVCGISGSTIVRNQGTFNWNNGDINPTGPYSCYYGAPPPVLLFNEAGGTLNIQAGSDISLGYTQIHNYGIVNKLNANSLTLQSACAGSPFYNYPSATFNLSQGHMLFYSGGSLEGNVNIAGTMTINSNINLGGQVSLTGSMYNNGSLTSLSGLIISGNGYLNNTGIFNLPFDVSFPVDIDNTGTIGGAGIKTYLSGIVVNMNGGTLGGNEHVFANGTILNVNAVCGISGSTIVRNQGTFNWNSGDINPTGSYSCYYGSGPPAILINEMGGVMNVNIDSDVKLGYTAVSNHGLIHLNTAFIWDFTSEGGCVPSSFNNSPSGMISGTGGMKFTDNYTFESGGSLQPGTSPGRITFHNNLNFGGSIYNCDINGSSPVNSYDVLKTTGNASIGNTVLNIDWDNFIPLQGQQFHVLSFGSRTGQFAGVNIPAISGKIFNVVYGDTSVYVTVTDVVTYYLDGDGDQYGLASMSMESATPIPGYVTQAGDCNDNNSSIHPNAGEICDGMDNDCDDLVDEGVLNNYFADADGDGYGDPMTTIQACTLPMSYVNNDEDCDDDNSNIHPLATEVCDGQDNDCDGEIDEGVLTQYFADGDGDGYGNAQISVEACSAPFGYSSNGDDCNDSAGGIHPGANEVCDGLDNDCDGDVDEGVKTTFYADADGDGYGNSVINMTACTAPSGYVENDDDCDDTNPDVHPQALELCDGIDNNCDQVIDDVLLITFYRDADGDGYGNASISKDTCATPAGYVANASDCDDANQHIHPGANEVCDLMDNDCDGFTDEGLTLYTYYADNDNDGFGNANISIMACTQPSGFVPNQMDCNDAMMTIYPGAVEVCNGLDDDCDGEVDENLSCPQPVAACGNIINIYTGSLQQAYSGPNGSKVFLVPAEMLDAGSTTSAPGTLVRQVKRRSTSVNINWTTNGACIDNVPNTSFNNNDKGYTWRDCMPVSHQDYNTTRSYDLMITDLYGVSQCYGRYRLIPGSAPTAAISMENEEDLMETRSLEKGDIRIYPNPAIHALYVENSGVHCMDCSFELRDALGRVIFRNLGSPQSLEVIDVSDFRNGIYTLSYYQNNEVSVFKWIKM